MDADEFCEDVAIIGRDGQVAPFEQLFRLESGPLAVDFAAFDWAAEHEHRVAVAIIPDFFIENLLMVRLKPDTTHVVGPT